MRVVLCWGRLWGPMFLETTRWDMVITPYGGTIWRSSRINILKVY